MPINPIRQSKPAGNAKNEVFVADSTSATGIAKYYYVHRGKALRITSLGHPVGQLLLPVMAVVLIKHFRMAGHPTFYGHGFFACFK